MNYFVPNREGWLAIIILPAFFVLLFLGLFAAIRFSVISPEIF
jgi:hypothetical protein